MFLLITMHLIILAYWLKRDHSFLINDGFDHYIVSLLKYSNLKNFFSDIQIQTQNITPFIKWHGTFHATICAFLLLFLPVMQDTAVFINAMIFFPTAIIFTYLIAKCFFDKNSAFLAAVIFSFLPIINQHTRVFLADLPLTALICGSIYFLIKSHRQPRFFNCFLFICFAISACFTKFNAVIFLYFPCLVFLFYNYKKNTHIISILVLLIASLLAIVLNPQIINRIFSCLWINIYQGELFPGFSDTIIVSFFNFISKSLYEMFNFGCSSVVFLLFIAGIIRLRINKLYNLSLLIILLVSIPIVTMGILLFIEYDIRYLMPILPFISIVSGFALSWVKNKYIKITIIMAVITFLIINYFNLFFSETNITGNTAIPFDKKINKILNSENFYKTLRLNPYEFYKRNPHFHFNQDTFFTFTPKKDNLFRSSLKMNIDETIPIEYSITKQISDIISSEKNISIFFMGKNRYIYNLLLETITKKNQSIHLLKAENHRQTKDLDLKKQMLLADYICITPKNDEIFADHKATADSYQSEINILLTDTEKLLLDFTPVYEKNNVKLLCKKS